QSAEDGDVREPLGRERAPLDSESHGERERNSEREKESDAHRPAVVVAGEDPGIEHRAGGPRVGKRKWKAVERAVRALPDGVQRCEAHGREYGLFRSVAPA